MAGSKWFDLILTVFRFVPSLSAAVLYCFCFSFAGCDVQGGCCVSSFFFFHPCVVFVFNTVCSSVRVSVPGPVCRLLVNCRNCRKQSQPEFGHCLLPSPDPAASGEPVHFHPMVKRVDDSFSNWKKGLNVNLIV